MKKRLLTLLLFLGATVAATAQDYNELTDDGVFKPADMREKSRKDTLGNKKKEIPRGLKVWTIDTRYGDRQMQIPDTLSHMFMNTGFTTGLRTEYNTPGNSAIRASIVSSRIARTPTVSSLPLPTTTS